MSLFGHGRDWLFESDLLNVSITVRKEALPALPIARPLLLVFGEEKEGSTRLLPISAGQLSGGDASKHLTPVEIFGIMIM